MRYCKPLIGGTLSRLRARACYSACRKSRAAGNTAPTGDLRAACPESVRSLNRYAVEGGPRQFGVVVAADGQADEDVLGHGDGLAGADLGPVEAIGRSIAGEGAAAAHQLDPVGQSNRGRVARRTAEPAGAYAVGKIDLGIAAAEEGIGVGGTRGEGFANHEAHGLAQGAAGGAKDAGDRLLSERVWWFCSSCRKCL